MSTGDKTTDNRNLIRQALLKIDALQAKLDASEAKQREPIAIVGMGCRFPGGGDGPDAFWPLLHEGRGAIAEVPASRWDIDAYYDPDPDAPGKMVQRSGGFLDGIDRFDPHFFGISPREAASMDPQQRLLLEVAWEALEDANIPADSLYRSPTGVFIGIMGQDFGQRLFAPSRHARLDAYAGTGTSPGMIAGRLSYCFGLTGPCFALDTACSSSLVALHLACDSLRRGESTLALTGGVNLILEPGLSINFSKARMLAPDGRCKTFDAAADGYVRGEGCGVLVLKRLADALADGDRVLAVVRGSAVNQDGPSGGLTVPSGPAQEQVIRQALANAGVTPAAVSYVEAHGTGTALGDPIELGALDRVFGAGHTSERPLYVGSVKTNLGHLEAAAGVAGVIKVVSALRRGSLPPHRNCTTPTPRFPWADKPLRVVQGPVAWPRGAEPRIAGVSSFGFSGTNAHIVIAEAPETPAAPTADTAAPWLLPLSARSPEALAAVAGRYHAHLRANPGIAPADLCAAVARGRAHLPHRLAVVADSTDAFADALEQVAEGRAAPAVITRGTADTGVPPLAFLFTGQGAQHPGMGRHLYDTQPVFRAALDRCAALLAAHTDIALIDLLSDETGRLDQTGNTQPALFCLEYALYELWSSLGVRPDAVLGHSVGEYVAACVAGVFSLEDGIRLIAARARLMQALPAGGAMASVTADGERVARAIAGIPALSIAALNGPEQTVIAGDGAALRRVLDTLRAEGVHGRELTVSHAFHSPLMDPMLDAFAAVAATVTFHPPALPLVSNVTGKPAGDDITRPGYWVRHVRDAVRFADGTAALQDLGCRVFVEIGPDPVLCGLARRCLPDGAVLIPSLRRTDPARFTRAVGELYVQGVAIDWKAVHPTPPTHLDLPTYPFQRKRCWFDDGAPAPALVTADGAEAVLQRLAAAGSLTAEELALAPKLIALLTQQPTAAEDGNGLCYRLAWREKPLAAAVPPTGGAWLVLGGDGVPDVAAAFRAAGRRCFAATLGRRFAATGNGAWTIANDDEDFRHLFAALAAEGTAEGALDGVVFLWPEAGDGGDAGLMAAVRLVRALAGLTVPPRLWLVTEAATEAGDGHPASPWPALLWGFGRTLFLEQPALKGGLIDVEPWAGADDRAALARTILAADGEDAAALRGGTRSVPRLEATAPPPARTVALDHGGAYLVTGGLGALGLRVAGLLAKAGAGLLVLMGRRGAAGVDAGVLTALEAAGARVTVAAADCADEASVRGVLADIAGSGFTLKGIVHAAGAATPQTILDLTPESLRAGLAAKVDGGWVLHRLTQDMALDFCVSFSSVSPVMGTAQQGVYTAANAFLDALAAHRRGLGLAASSIGWGPWDGGGLAGGDATRLIAATGFKPLEPDRAIALFGRLLAADAGRTIVADADWRRLRDVFEARSRLPVLEGLGTPTPRGSAAAVAAERERLAALPARDRGDALIAFLQDQIRAVLRFEPGFPVDPRRGFFDMGLDSLTAAELKQRIDTQLGCSLPSSAVFDHPNITALAGCVLGLVFPEAPKAEPAPAPKRAAPPDADVQTFTDSELAALIDDELAALTNEGWAP